MDLRIVVRGVVLSNRFDFVPFLFVWHRMLVADHVADRGESCYVTCRNLPLMLGILFHVRITHEG